MSSSKLVSVILDPKKDLSYETLPKTVMVALENTGATNIEFDNFNFLGPGDSFSTPVVNGIYFKHTFKFRVKNDALKANNSQLVIRSLIVE
jgi:hypothetical protein